MFRHLLYLFLFITISIHWTACVSMKKYKEVLYRADIARASQINSGQRNEQLQEGFQGLRQDTLRYGELYRNLQQEYQQLSNIERTNTAKLEESQASLKQSQKALQQTQRSLTKLEKDYDKQQRVYQQKQDRIENELENELRAQEKLVKQKNELLEQTQTRYEEQLKQQKEKHQQVLKQTQEGHERTIAQKEKAHEQTLAQRAKAHEQTLKRKEEQLKVAQEQAKASENVAKAWRQELEGALQSYQQQDYNIQIQNGQTVLSIAEPALFDPIQWIVLPKGEKLLGQIATLLNNHPKKQLTILGHTDNLKLSDTSAYRDNWELSWFKAKQIMEVLANVHQVNPQQIIIAGAGEFHAIADNRNFNGRIQNRRTELIFW